MDVYYSRQTIDQVGRGSASNNINNNSLLVRGTNLVQGISPRKTKPRTKTDPSSTCMYVRGDEASDKKQKKRRVHPLASQ
jgi:hypothetical protein